MPQPPAHDVGQVMSDLRSALTQQGPDGPSATLSHLDALERCVQKLLQEHGGMAEELLQVYEQLGVVFEVTRQLPNIHDEQQVLGLFEDTLRPNGSELRRGRLVPVG